MLEFSCLIQYRWMRFFIYGGLLILSVAFADIRQDRAEGIVRDAKSGSPLKAVRFEIEGNLITQSDSLGRFSLKIQDSIAVVTCYKPNYWITQYSLYTSRFNNLQLPPVAYDMDGIFVYGNRRSVNTLQLPVAPLRLESEQIPEYSSSAQIVNLFPGVSLKTYGGPAGVSNLSLYGGQGDRIAVLLDGAKLNSEQNGSADLSQIPAELLDTVELYPYGASNRFGSSAMTGVVNFNIKNEEFKFRQSLGSFGRRGTTLFAGNAGEALSAGIALGRNHYDGSYAWHEDGSYYPTAMGRNFDSYHNTRTQDFGYASLKGRSSHNFIYRFSGLLVSSKRSLSGQIYTQPYRSAMEDRLELYTLEAGLPDWRFSTRYKVSTLRYRKPAGTGPAIDSGSHLATWQYQITLYRHLSRWSVEAEYVRDKSRNLSFGQVTRIDTSRTLVAFTNETTLTPHHVKITLSGRVELESRHSAAVAWSFSAQRKIGERFREIALIISQNYKKPTFNDLYWKPFGDPNLKTETSRNLYLRNRLAYQNLQLELDLFYIRYDNLIQWTPQTGATALWRPENIRAGESRGYHIGADLPITSGFRFKLGLDRNLTRNYDKSVGAEHYGKPFYYTPEYLLKASAVLSVSGFNLFAGYERESERIRLYGPADLKLPAYGTLDISAGRSWEVKSVSLKGTLLIENVLDEQYQLVLGYPQPGRSLSLTVELKPRKEH
ncbi:MAG: TonB-dependent receptor [FCB group bacterium]|nr:TonB-dependent receptor [FCB group bacterium]